MLHPIKLPTHKRIFIIVVTRNNIFFFLSDLLNLPYKAIIIATIIIPVADIISEIAKNIMLIIINKGCFAFLDTNLYIIIVIGKKKNIKVSEVNS